MEGEKKRLGMPHFGRNWLIIGLSHQSVFNPSFFSQLEMWSMFLEEKRRKKMLSINDGTLEKNLILIKYYC